MRVPQYAGSKGQNGTNTQSPAIRLGEDSMEPVEYCAQSLRVQMSAVLVVAVPGRRSLLSGSAGVLLEDVVGVRRVGEGDVFLPSRSLLKRDAVSGGVDLQTLRPMRMRVGMSTFGSSSAALSTHSSRASGRLAGDSKLASTIFTLSGSRGSRSMGSPLS
jgi:hypothetical protein